MNLLVIRFSSAGDIVLTSLFVRALRRRFPDATIHYLTKQEFAPLLDQSPHINRVITIGKNDGRGQLGALKVSLLRQLGGRYDVAYDLHNSLRSRWFRRGVAKRVEVIKKPSLKKRLLVWFKWNVLRPIIPIPELYLEVGKRDGVANDGEGLELFTGAIISPIPPLPGSLTVAFAPGARHQTKQWPPERFIELGKSLQERYQARIVLFGSAPEQQLCQMIADGIAAETFGDAALRHSPQSIPLPLPLNLAGTTSWLETAAALDSCDVVVTNDSAMAHIAAARKRPVVAVFGSTVPEFGFAPYGTRSAVVGAAGLGCRPCSTIGRDRCPKGHFRCMMDIEAGRVLEGIEGVKG